MIIPRDYVSNPPSLLQACRTETKALLQNIPQEECDLEPHEHCKMETVLVPRYTWGQKRI